MRRIRPVSTVLFVIAISALVGGLFGRRALAVDDRVAERYATFSAALSAIESQYVDKVESDRVVYSAIRGMLSTLDPHSSFFDPREYAQMRERQEGRYYGLGITIQSVNGDITAASVFEGSPAYKQGIRRGDILSKINGEDAKGWTTEQAMKNLRGPRDTVVTVDIRRRGYDTPIPLKVTRDEVQIPTVAAHFMIDATTGYIKHSDWGENTDREIQRALTDLRSKGMKRLLYDIRGNPGGPLDQAIKVSNEFLPKGKMIVYTRGRIRNSDQDYRATEDSTYLDIPMVVLANRNSASASEIFTGALQDHDRAYLVGETTFGKALVQSVYPISNGAGLALTTAHYFTPSDRLIQRPWDETFDEYLSYTQKDQDATRPHKASDLRKTESGRPVYSGGGIEPDKYVPGTTEGFNPTPFARALVGRQAFDTYSQKFIADGDTRINLPVGKGWVVVKPNFSVDDQMLKEFREQLVADHLRIDETAFQKDLTFIKAMLRFKIDEAAFGIAEARRHMVEVDPQAQAGIASFGEAEKLAGLQKSSPSRAQ
ncbi:MAG: S41 family peptidase [Vicinamibacterales bacterium]